MLWNSCQTLKPFANSTKLEENRLYVIDHQPGTQILVDRGSIVSILPHLGNSSNWEYEEKCQQRTNQQIKSAMSEEQEANGQYVANLATHLKC